MKPPMPRLSGSLSSHILGHLGDLGAFSLVLDPAGERAKAGGLTYRLHQRLPGWYDETSSKTFRLNAAGATIVYTKDPLVYKEILGPNQKHFTNGDAFRKTLGYLIPQSMIVIEGDQWTRVRKVATRAMARQMIDELPVTVGETLDKLLHVPDAATENGSPVAPLQLDPAELFTRASFDIFHKIMYKWDPDTASSNSEALELLNSAIVCTGAVGDRVLLPFEWLWRLPLPSNRRIDAARDAMRAKTTSLIHARMATLTNADVESLDLSLLDAMIVAASEGKLSEKELIDQVQTFFFGAFDTTSHTVAILLNHLAHNSRVQDTLRAELYEAFPGGYKTIPTLEVLDQCAYLTHVLNESMRLTPFAVAIARTCVAPCTIHGYSFDKGSQVIVDCSEASKDPANYPGQADLDEFRPERFDEVRFDKTVTLPFGFGGRICPGRKIALGELKAMCAYVVMGWKLSRQPNVPFLMDMTLGLNMREGHGMLNWESIK
ncbi:Aste57867_12665 [Aphanomyces stellatus]|uniref:Aste57867_12665 protein n=1 Tax=Aphanomyces stellatus TaxID=120398 RepID=A0A485KXI6_9STRA|nr:hypothetical protein As57867_012619 [Aphanomyces stellatus]VFT89515.1 Aste57867_12665 [Aphanomyces stellatus]